MPDPNFTRINTVPYSWTSCAHFFSGLPYKGLTNVSFKETREVKLVHAAQQDGTPLGITSGIYKVDSLSWTLLRSSAVALMADLSVLGLGSYGDAEFTYLLQLFEPSVNSAPPIPVNYIIAGCRITGVEDKQEMGVDELVTEITAQGLYIIRTVGGVPLKLWSTVRTLLP